MKKLFRFLFVSSLIAGGLLYYFRNSEHLQPYIQIDQLISDYVPSFSSSEERETKEEIQQEPSSTKKSISNNQNTFSEIDRYARNTPRKVTRKVETLSTYLAKPAKTDIEKARVIFTWLTSNIVYDGTGLDSGKYGDLSPKGVLKSRKAVCEGFARLYVALGEAMGLNIRKVIGYAKGLGYRQGKGWKNPDHAWNAIEIDGDWRLFDATWGQGSGTTKNGKTVCTVKFNPFWFNTDPNAFIFSHLPEDPKWQLIKSKISNSQYTNMHVVSTELFKIGVKPKLLLKKLLEGEITKVVEAFETNSPIKLEEAPLERYLTTGEAYTFKLETNHWKKIALINNKKWHYLKKENGSYFLDFIPQTGDLQLCIGMNEGNFHTVLKYKVRASGV